MMDFGAPFAAVVIGDGARGADETVALAGGRVVARVGWGEAIGDRDAVLVAELEGMGDDAIDAGLTLVAASGLPIVATLTLAQVELVFGTLPHAELLVQPTMLERVAALAVAAGRLGAGRSGREVREGDGDAEPWRAQVARIAEQLARIARDEPGAATGDVADRRTGYGAQPGDEPVDPADIRRTIRARRLRDGFLGAGLFEDPAWDMLLDLFAAELERTRVSVSSLCIAAAVAPTTALRWIGRLADAGLLAREADPDDRRRAFVVLSERARAGMAAYVAAVRRAGLPIA